MNIEISLYQQVREVLESARNLVYKTANSAMVQAYWQVGKLIVEKQGGESKAEYVSELLKELSKELTRDFGKGFTLANIKNMRQFYLTFPKSYAVRSELTWTHYRLLMRIENENARKYYEEECVNSNWSTRQLERQISTLYYERLLASQEKKPVIEEMQNLALPTMTPQDIIKDPTY